MNVDTGITSEVLTIKSETKLTDIFNEIISKKSQAVYEYIEKLNLDDDSKIIVIGTYFTGVGIVKRLSEKYNDILLIDIYPHLKELLNTEIGGELKNNVNFSSDLDLIYSGDVVIDTTGFGGINESQSKSIFSNVFLIEDPVAEDNDSLLKTKNNINRRADLVNSNHKYILKTKGLNTKTSGTMTFTIDVARQSMNALLARKGVLYCSSEMTFFEEIIFKEKDLDRFFSLIESPAIKVSTILPFDCDDVIREFIDEIHSEILIR
jgi:hypothetical protein